MENKQKTIIIFDKNEDFRSALSFVLKNKYNFSILGQAASSHELSNLFHHRHSDMVLMGVDFDYQEDLANFSHFISKHPKVKTIAVCEFNEPILNQYLESIGFDQVVPKDGFYKEFKSIIRKYQQDLS